MSIRLPSPLLAIEGHGAVTCIGHSAAQTVASWLAQARKFSRVQVPGHREPFTAAACSDLPAGLDESERLVAMLGSAVAEAEQQHEPAAAPARVWLLLPPGLAPATAEALRSAAAGGTAAAADVRVLEGGCTLAAAALEEAFQAVQGTPRVQHLRIAAVDSLCLQQRLQQAADEGVLHQPGNADGWVPGEAAACLDLRRIDDITAARAGQFALHRPALADAGAPWWPTQAPASHHALQQALQAALRHAGMEGRHISHLLSDMDGSGWRALLEAEALAPLGLRDAGGIAAWRPAALLGQVGTATGVLQWLLPAAAHRHHAAAVNTVMSWSLDPAGRAAAGVLERSPF